MRRGLEQKHEIGCGFQFQRGDQVDVVSQHRLDFLRGAVAALNPYHLGRRIRKLAELLEVRVLADYYEPVLERRRSTHYPSATGPTSHQTTQECRIRLGRRLSRWL